MIPWRKTYIWTASFCSLHGLVDRSWKINKQTIYTPENCWENPPQYEETCPIESRHFPVSHVGFQWFSGWKAWISYCILGTESQLGKPGPFFSTYWTCWMLHPPSEGMRNSTATVVGGFNPPKKMRNFWRMSCNQEEFSDQNWTPFFAHVLPFRLCRVTWNSAIFVPQKLRFEPKLFGVHDPTSAGLGTWCFQNGRFLEYRRKHHTVDGSEIR